MAKKPNYDFERKERERLKKQKNEQRALAKQTPASDDDLPAGADDHPPEDKE